MSYRVIGKERVEYTNKDGKPVKGYALHTYTNKDKVDGLAVERIFVSDKLELSNIDLIKPEMDVDILYNRYGKIEKIEIC